jgi:DNA-binding transcriptional ArsR family regulator
MDLEDTDLEAAGAVTADELDPVIHVPARLRIMVTLAALADGDHLSFPRLQQLLGLTPGNLITHLRKLQDAGYVASAKPGGQSALYLTHAGRAALGQYTETLRRLLDQASPPRLRSLRSSVTGCQARFDEGAGDFRKPMAGDVGGVPQGALPGEHRQPVHHGPDGVLDPGAPAPAEDAGVGQFVEYRAELVQGQGALPGPAVGSAVGVLMGPGEGSREQARLLAGELQVRPADRAQAAAGGRGIAVLAAHAADAGRHAGGELAHGRRADRGQKLVPVGEVPVGGVGHDAHHPYRLAEHDGVGAAGPGQLQPGGDQPLADGAARAPPPGPGCLTR